MLSKLQNIEFGDKFVILDQIEASNLYTCVKKSTSEEFVCKVCFLVLIYIELIANLMKSFVQTLFRCFPPGVTKKIC